MRSSTRSPGLRAPFARLSLLALLTAVLLSPFPGLPVGTAHAAGTCSAATIRSLVIDVPANPAQAAGHIVQRFDFEHGLINYQNFSNCAFAFRVVVQAFTGPDTSFEYDSAPSVIGPIGSAFPATATASVPTPPCKAQVDVIEATGYGGEPTDRVTPGNVINGAITSAPGYCVAPITVTKTGTAQSSSSSSSARPQCSDGLDNDGDGLIDAQDPGCHYDLNPLNPGSYQPEWNDESRSNVGQCSDGIDNDHDGLIDIADPDCHTDGNASNLYSYDGRRNEGSTSSSSSSSAAGTSSGGQNSGGQNYWSDTSANTTVNNQVNNAAQNNTNVGSSSHYWWGNVTVNPTANAATNNQVNAGTFNAFAGGWWGGFGNGTVNTTVNNQTTTTAQNNTAAGNGSSWWGSAIVNTNANATTNNQVNAGAFNGWRW